MVIGKNQNAFSEVNLDARKSIDGRLARRLTGGGAVYHDRNNLNFTFVAKEGVYDVKKQLSVIVRSLERWGIRAVVSGRNDILAEGRKFSGNAFLRENGFGLHHGTVLINTDIEVMTRVLNVDKVKLDSKGVKSVSARVLNLSELNGNIEKRALIEEIRSAAEEIYGMPAQEIKAAFNAENARMKAMLSSKEWLLNRVREQSYGYIVRRVSFDWGGVELIYKQEAC